MYIIAAWRAKQQLTDTKTTHAHRPPTHPGSSILLPGPGGSDRPVLRHGGLTREAGVIRSDSAEVGGSSRGSGGVWGAEDGQLGFGMTQARQRSIQGAVVSMMGGGASGSGSGSAGGGGRGGSASTSTSSRRRAAGKRNGHNDNNNNGGDAAVAAAAAEWACELCTLLNPGRRPRCEACGAGKPPVARSPRGNGRSPSPVPPLPPPPPPQQQQQPAAPAPLEMHPPDDAVLPPPGAVGGGEGKEEETEEAKAADPDGV